MLQSPAKKRKLDDSEPKSVDNAAHDNVQPTTPTRASYLSPTKSSLSRSHPHLVARSTPRAATDSRGKSLRDEILNRKSRLSEAPKSVSRITKSQGLRRCRRLVAESDGREPARDCPESTSRRVCQLYRCYSIHPESTSSSERKTSSRKKCIQRRGCLSHHPAQTRTQKRSRSKAFTTNSIRGTRITAHARRARY